jgi:rRNA maturation endonuclease Nob1
MSDEQIAKECGINRATLHRWKQKDFFKAAVAQIRDIFSQQVTTEGLARMEVRVREKRDRHRAIKQELAIRAQMFKEDPPSHANVSGAQGSGDTLGATGYVVRKLKMIGSGPAAKTVEEYEIDTRSSQELSRLEEEIAVELGQRIEKHEHEVRGYVFVATKAIGSQGELTPASERQLAKQITEEQRIARPQLEG